MVSNECNLQALGAALSDHETAMRDEIMFDLIRRELAIGCLFLALALHSDGHEFLTDVNETSARSCW